MGFSWYFPEETINLIENNFNLILYHQENLNNEIKNSWQKIDSALKISCKKISKIPNEKSGYNKKYDKNLFGSLASLSKAELDFLKRYLAKEYATIELLQRNSRALIPYD